MCVLELTFFLKNDFLWGLWFPTPQKQIQQMVCMLSSIQLIEVLTRKASIQHYWHNDPCITDKMNGPFLTVVVGGTAVVAQSGWWPWHWSLILHFQVFFKILKIFFILQNIILKKGKCHEVAGYGPKCRTHKAGDQRHNVNVQAPPAAILE